MEELKQCNGECHCHLGDKSICKNYKAHCICCKPMNKIEILKEFQEKFYEDVHYMTRHPSSITPVGVRFKNVSPIEAHEWLSKALDQVREQALREVEKVIGDLPMYGTLHESDRGNVWAYIAKDIEEALTKLKGERKNG